MLWPTWTHQCFGKSSVHFNIKSYSHYKFENGIPMSSCSPLNTEILCSTRGVIYINRTLKESLHLHRLI